MRGSDPDVAIYYLAKMLYAGEDPRFIARRIVICASEDVGNADPMALIVATSALRAVEFIGMLRQKYPRKRNITTHDFLSLFLIKLYNFLFEKNKFFQGSTEYCLKIGRHL